MHRKESVCFRGRAWLRLCRTVIERGETMRKEETEKAGGGMTVREAGKRGGMIRKRELGHQGYEELGKKGGSRVRELIRKGREAEQKGS